MSEKIIHVETPADIKRQELESKERAPEKSETEIKKENEANASGPKSNPDPRANGNIPADKQHKSDGGTGTEITDGEAG